MGFQGPFGIDRNGAQPVIDPFLRTGDIVPIGRRDVFGAVEIDKAASAVGIQDGEALRDFIRQAAVLVDADKEGPVVHVGLPGEGTAFMRGGSGVIYAPFTAQEPIGLLLCKRFIHNKFVAYQQQAAARLGPQAFGRSLQQDFGIFRPQGRGQDQVLHIMQTLVRHAAAQVRVGHGDFGIMDMEPQAETGLPDAAAQVHEGLPVKARLPQIMAAGAGKIRIIQDHGPESARPGIRDMPVKVLRGDIPQLVVRVAVICPPAAFHALGQAVVRLHARDDIEETLRGCRDQDGPRAFHAHRLFQAGIEGTAETVYPGLRIDTHQADGRALVPGDIQPTAEMRPLHHRQLHQG